MNVLYIAIKIDQTRLSNPAADLRYKLPEHIQYATDGLLKDDGYDYLNDGTLVLFLVGDDEAAVTPMLDAVLQEPFLDNDLTGALVVAVDVGDGFRAIYPEGFQGDLGINDKV